MRTIHQAVKIIFFRCDYLNKKSYLSKAKGTKKALAPNTYRLDAAAMLIINGLLLFTGEDWVNGFFNW